jgi:hypothetical protein
MQIDGTLKTGIWHQFGATIDYLADTVRDCPDRLWLSPMWNNPDEPPEFSKVWYRVYHTLFWLDLYLTGAEEGFVPPTPFTLIEQDDAGPLPERPYTKQELQAYLEDCRQRCRATIEALTDEKAQRICRFPWGEASFLELLLYNMRHVQEHASQLSLLLGQQGVSVSDYVTQTRSDVSGGASL